MGNPGLPDPRVAPRVSPSLLTFTPIHPLLVSLLLLPFPFRTHILLVSIHPLVRDPPLPSADLNDIFEGKFRRNRGKHFVLGGASLLPAYFSSPFHVHRVPLFSLLCSSSPFLRSGKQNSTDPSIHLPYVLCPLHQSLYSRWNGDTVTWGQLLRMSCASILQLTVYNTRCNYCREYSRRGDFEVRGGERERRIKFNAT